MTVMRCLICRDINDPPEFVRTSEIHFTRTGLLYCENKGAAIGVTAATGIPVMVSYRTEARVFFCEAFKGSIDRLFFRTDQAYLDFAFLQSKDLRPEHGRIRDSDKLELFLLNIIAGNDEEPRPVRGPMNVSSLNLPVY